MPSLISTIMISQIKFVREKIKNLDISEARKYQDALGELGSKALKGKIRFESEPFDDFEADMAIPENFPREDFAVLYLHGGSYTAGSLSYCRGFGGILSDLLNVPVLCVAYRLAPEFPFPAALDDAMKAYLRLREKFPPEKIFFIGESAGGGLCFALANKLLEDNLPVPAGIVAISPWTDLTFTGESYERNKKDDPSLSEESLKKSARLYYGSYPAESPLISPLYLTDFRLPPAFIITGNKELLEDDGAMLARKLSDNGVECTYHCFDGMWHVFPLLPVPESKIALDEIKEFCYAKRYGASQRTDKD